MKMELLKLKYAIAVLAAGLFIVSTTTTGCYYDKEEILYPQTVCDTEQRYVQ